MNFIQIFLPDMLAANEGHFVASASVAGLVPDLVPDHVPYSGAKMGIIGMMLNLRRELENTGVQSTVFVVASVEGGMKANNTLYRPARFGGPYQEEVALPANFKPRTAQPPEQVAPMVINAIRRNRPMLVSDPARRKDFMERYLPVVLQAFDDVDEFFRLKTAG